MPSIEKNVQFTIAVPGSVFKNIEENRGNNSRSDYIRTIIEKSTDTTLRKENGSVYTPQRLADFVATKLIHYFNGSNKDRSKNKPITVIDPACGDGELLLSFKSQYPNTSKLKLFGLDIDKRAIMHAKKRFSKQEAPSFINTNGLCPFNKTNDNGWITVKKRFSVSNQFDCVIANPPWGAKTDSYKHLIDESNFKLNVGQTDSSDLFIESSLKLIKAGGLIAFIIPDSLFYHERQPLRKFLLSNTNIKFIGRFGEKIFKDVNRACAVIICQKTDSPSNGKVDCFRLPPDEKKLIMSGHMTFHEAENKLSHPVNQNRFLKNNGHSFNIDLNTSLENTFNKIVSSSNSLSNYLSSTRGIELSKRGKVYQCKSCALWFPLPKNELTTCKNCKTDNLILHCKVDNIIHTEKSKGRKSLLVGEHIKRYISSPSLWIDMNREGINYKSDKIYQAPKIVIRKTGIGISSSIDYTNSYTNQVVYIFRPIPTSINLPLEFYLAVINSRLVFFYTTMMNGENEWKSHPYVTQTQVLNIPVPDLTNIDNKQLKIIKKLSLELKNCLLDGKKISNKLDAKLEMMVANIYQANKNDYKSIYSVIDSCQDLLPVQALKNISVNDIFTNKA